MVQTQAGVFTYGYDVLDQLVSEASSYPAPTPYSGLTTTTYDANCRRIGLLSTGLLTTATYDPADQLHTLATTTTLTLPYPFGYADLLLWQQLNPLTSLTYDPNGSLVVAQTGAYRTSYTWDAANRLHSVSLPGGGLYTHSYRFDDLRQGRQGPNNTDTFVYAFTDPLAQRDGLLGWGTNPASGAGSASAAEWSSETAPLLWWQRSGGASEWFVQSGGVPGLMRAVGQASTGGALNRQYHPDRLGSIQATSLGNATPETTLTYDAWGNRLYPFAGPFPGTPIGAFAFTPSATGFGQALSFNLTNKGYISLPPSVWTPTTAFSVSCRFQSTDSGSTPAILFGVSSSASPQQFWFGIQNGVMRVNGLGLSTPIIGTANVHDGNWHTALVTYSGGVWTLYVDGVQDGPTGSGSYVPEPTVLVTLSGEPISGTYDFSGLIDEVAIFNTVISGTVQTAPWANTTSGLVALYHLDGTLEDSGQTSLNDNRLGYGGAVGYWEEPELGLEYVRARWLEPQTGSWLSVDPVSGEPRYSYAHNMPTFKVDPSGRQSGPPPGTPPADAIAAGAGSYYVLGQTIADTPAVKTGIEVGVAHGFAAGWDAFVRVLVDSNEPAWRQTVEAAAKKEQVGIKKVEAVIGHDAMSIMWKSFSALIPIDLPLSPPMSSPDYIRFGGGLLWGLVSAGLHFFLDTPADIVRLVQMIGWIFRPGKALNELGKCVSAFVKSLTKLVNNVGNMFPYDRGVLVGHSIISVVGLILLGKGAIAAAKNLPLLLKAAINSAQDLRASVNNASVIVGITKFLTKARTPEEVYAAAKTEAEGMIREPIPTDKATDVQEAGTGGDDAPVTMYRAQGRDLITVDEHGNVTIKFEPRRRRISFPGRRGVTIHIGFDKNRALFWVTGKPAKEVVVVNVRKGFLEYLRETAEPENLPHGQEHTGERAWRVDIDYPDQYAIPSGLFDQLRNAIIQGTGRVYTREEFVRLFGSPPE